MKILLVPLSFPKEVDPHSKESVAEGNLNLLIFMAKAFYLNLGRYYLDSSIEVIKLEHDFYEKKKKKQGAINGIRIRVILVPDIGMDKVNMEFLWERNYFSRVDRIDNKEGFIGNAYNYMEAVIAVVHYLATVLGHKSSNLATMSKLLLGAEGDMKEKIGQ